ncbi:MAG TPA: RES family NAD+ phosphorylase [Bryobacteraceae bacterium]|nr:RES family NAD+ phosphorylase [Bryobacteraceae bacterium]
MLSWRIVIPDYAAEPLSGAGAARWGSRWNSPGVEMVYAASSRPLAVLEMLVHLTRDRLPSSAVLIPIEIPDESIAGLPALPDGWNSHPHGQETQWIGDQWIAEARSLAMFVPSAVIPAERNILINPGHARFGEIRVGDAEPHAFDRRLFGLR